MELLGVILCGGLSSRLGQNKALLKLRGSTTLLKDTWELLGSVTPSRILATREPEPYLEYPYILDAGPRIGPAGAILTALNYAAANGFAAILAVACDMPFLNVAMLLRLVEAFNLSLPTQLETVWCAKTTQYLQHLTAIYRIQARPYFVQRIENKVYALQKMIPNSLQKRVYYTAQEAHYFHNINTQENLSQALQILQSAN